MVEVSLTVGKLDASLALLLTNDHHLIEFPTILLPDGVKAGSIIKIRCDQDIEGEKQEEEEFQKIQDEILNTFGKDLPQAPKLRIKNVTQTSCVLEWDPLILGTASLKNLILFRDDKKLGTIPQPLTNMTTKLSGLPIDKTFHFQLRLDTSAGTYQSDTIEVKTHKMTDLSGITVCLGDVSPNEPFTVNDIKTTLANMGAHELQTTVSVGTTHFVCTRENKENEEYLKAYEMNIPIIRPEWLKACERERRIVGVRDFYVKDCVLPDILSKNYWQSNSTTVAADARPPNDDQAPETLAGLEENSSEQPVPTIKEPTPENQEPQADEVLVTNKQEEQGEMEEAVEEASVNEEVPIQEAITEASAITDIKDDAELTANNDIEEGQFSATPSDPLQTEEQSFKSEQADSENQTPIVSVDNVKIGDEDSISDNGLKSDAVDQNSELDSVSAQKESVSDNVAKSEAPKQSNDEEETVGSLNDISENLQTGEINAKAESQNGNNGAKSPSKKSSNKKNKKNKKK